MLRSTFLLVLAALSCHATSSPSPLERIYQSVLIGDYDSAVSESKNYQGDTIVDVVAKLIENGKRNVIDYAVALWNNDGQDIVKNDFPLEIRSIIGQHLVKLIGKRDNMVVKLGAKVDRDGDRVAYGDSNHMIGDRMAWKLIPVLDSQVYFKVYYPQKNLYLKLGRASDSHGDHSAYGSKNSGGYEHQWFLVPVKHEGEILFYIYNREYQQALKLSRAVDSEGDRKVLSEHSNVIGSPYTFGWIIKPL